ncbi:MAG: sigma-70 family RNA polymerase sigma factor [Piscinibacter sp.]|nr:sigma-70 family RNA polymerase sigma factor [Piscinibacter sp.]
MGDITQLIAQARSGDRSAFDSLFQKLYPELRRIAHGRLARNVRDTLMSTTALVHECYLKLLQAQRLRPEDRAHFLAYAASVMRSIVVDAARAGLAERRGGAAEHLPLDTNVGEAVAAPEEQILDVSAALDELAQLDERLARVVEMRYFGGMKDTEIAAALGLTDRTVRRDWEKARLLLAHALRE